MPDFLMVTFQMFADLVGVIGVLVMLFGVFHAVYLLLRSVFHPIDGTLQLIRIRLGMYLELGLEFLIGKDIIETILMPTYDELGKLVIIILLRLLLSYVLAKEIAALSDEMKAKFHSPLIRRKHSNKKGSSLL